MTNINKLRLANLLSGVSIVILFIGVVYSCNGQDNHEPIIITARVERIPVNYYRKEATSLSQVVMGAPTSIERVQIIFIGVFKTILLITQCDTLELVSVKNRHGLYIDYKTRQLYGVYLFYTKKGKFIMTFTPIGYRYLYTFRSEGYKPDTVFTYRTPHLHSINIQSL